ncbi:CDK5 regulatory subunit-associated protein 2 isoform X1 [Ochotona princeps]|uniref:CDK5 regulatory subunit-associated protein 2 isoform X1 n=1 Tax=Ochotona princeps TaxID=9978 RepID=UPI002714FDA7|nr:CDK5 regulatory subunit-associated protein 2 isoform X1 [Ochotona princeps]
MDSVLEGDVTLPGTLSGCSGLLSTLPDNLEASLGNGVLPNIPEEKVSPTRARNMKDFENQITDLKKENFNLKLRIYFLEERMQQEFDGPTEHIYKTNIELKVEVESLKRELQERERLLIKASKAVESLAEGSGSEIQRLKEDARKKVEQVEDLLTEKDVKAAQAELEKTLAAKETEKALRLSLESKLSEMTKTHQGDVALPLLLQERDRLIEELKLSLKSKEALIQRLKEEKSLMASPDGSVAPGVCREEEEARVAEALREDLREKEREIATEKNNSLKRDKAIQGLTMALKSKEKEVAKLHSEIKELSAALAKAREAPQTAQAQKLQQCQDYETALAQKEALLAELHSENQRLRGDLNKVTQELSDLQRERGRLAQALEEARGQKSEGDRTIHDLRKEVEKLRTEVNEREKAMEQRCEGLPREGGRLRQSRQQEIRSLAESASEKDLLLQKLSAKDLEAVQQNHSLVCTVDLWDSDVVAEKSSCVQAPGSSCVFSQEKQQSDYEELIQVLKKEQDIYANLVKSLQDSNSVSNLQAELNNIFALRKQLEQDVLLYQNLQKTLEEMMSGMQRREEESLSLYSDQTSYLSICLEDHSRLQVEHFSQEELKKKVGDLIQLVKELYADNQHLKKALLDLSCLSLQGNDRLEATEPRELLASQEDEDALRTEEDDRAHLLSDQRLQPSDEVLEDYPKGGGKNGYLRAPSSSTVDYDGPHKSFCPGEQSLGEGELMRLLAPFFNEKAVLLLESRPDLVKVLCELFLERIQRTEQEVSGEHFDEKTEKRELVALSQTGGLDHLLQASSLFVMQDELKSCHGTQLVKAGEASRVELRDASVQTLSMEGSQPGLGQEGERETCEEKPTDALVPKEPQLEAVGGIPGQQTPSLSFPSASNKDAKKSRLPILIKPCQSLGSMGHPPPPQDLVAQLQDQILQLQGELKELQTQNMHLHRKLILAEATTESRPAPDETLLNAQPFAAAACGDSPGEPSGVQAAPSNQHHKDMVDAGQQTSHSTDSEICPPDDLAILTMCQENPEDFLGATSGSPSLSSKSLLSVKVRLAGTDQCENTNASNDTEYLKQKIQDLETELEGYRNFMFQLQRHSPCSEATLTILCGTEGAQDGLNKSKGSTDEEEMTFSSLHQVRYVKHMKILHPLAPEVMDDSRLDSLKQQLVEQEYELQKEQNLNVELCSEIHSLQNKFKDLSPSRYDSLVQSQARELSLQRQQIKDSHGICVIYRQHMNTMVKAFEELLQASDVDRCVAEGFREQLNQCSELLQELEKLFLNGTSAAVETSLQKDLAEGVEEGSSTYQRILPESPEPSASHGVSDYEVSEKSSLSGDPRQDSETEKTSGTTNNFSQDLLMEHIQEIRTLRKRLEESIKTNEKLRKQLERQGSEFDQGSTNVFTCGSELHSSLMSEINFLRKQNQVLNTMLVRGSRDKQKENEKLRESLSRKTATLEHLGQEYAAMKGDNERLQRELSEKETHTRQLIREICSGRSELSRMQEEVKWRQQMLSQNDKLLQSLRVELKVYEQLEEERRKQPEARAAEAGEGWPGQGACSDLRGLLLEIQALRQQLERSIDTNHSLQSKLEEQLAQGSHMAQAGALTLAVQTVSMPEQPVQPDRPGSDKCPMLSGNSFELLDSIRDVTPKSASETPPPSPSDMDSLSCDNGSSAASNPGVPSPAVGHCLWASKSGCHVLGLIEDYEALCKQIDQSQRLLAEIDVKTQEAPDPTGHGLGTKASHLASLSKFLTSVDTAKLLLEEASRLLRHLWRVSLPTGGQCTLHCEQVTEMKAEITKLHKKLFEQEKKLQSTVRLLQQSKHQEKVIFDQLVVTHKVLRKARGNLELRPGSAHPGTSSPSRPGS